MPAVQVGWVQAAVLFPSLLFMLWGGALADRLSLTTWLTGLSLANLSLYGCLWWLLSPLLSPIDQTDPELGLVSLMVFAIGLGTITTFIQPARERLLAHCSDKTLQRKVIQVSFCQYLGQALGIVLAGQIDQIGVANLVLIQMALVALFALLYFWVARSVNSQNGAQHHDASVKAGLLEVLSSGTVRLLILLVTFSGLIHIGTFVVALPLITRDIYQQPASHYAWLQLAFVLGTLVSTYVLMRKDEVVNSLRAVIFCWLYSGVILLAISKQPTFWGLLSLIFFWGVVVGVSASLGRVFMQAHAKPAFKGRAMSIYQLALFGSAPLGALVTGYIVESVGMLETLSWAGYISFGVFTLCLVFSPVWRSLPENDLVVDKEHIEES